MRQIQFVKMVASGNDFVVVEVPQFPSTPALKALAKKICQRKYGVGADGLLVLEKSRIADVRMRVFNPDGSEAQMCGNGARCVALYRSHVAPGGSHVKIETKAGIIYAEVINDNVKIKLTDPTGLRLDIPILINNRKLQVNYINTGVPHTVIFVESLDKINVVGIGRLIRYHNKFIPKGTNVDFIEVLSRDSIKIRTYERGVEDETLACGTGVVASALIFSLKTKTGNEVKVLTKSREVLTVYFRKAGNRFSDVWLQGMARIVHKGEYYV